MDVITDLNEIDTTTKEGRLLFAALAKITTESQTDKTPYQVLEQLEELATKIDASKNSNQSTPDQHKPDNTMPDNNEQTMFDEMKKFGSTIPDRVEYLKANGWQPYKHHDNWVKSTWLDTEKNSSLLDLNKAFEQCVKDQLFLRESINVLMKALREDQGLYIAYQANIAMAFYDEFNQQMSEREDFTKWLLQEGGLHKIANDASTNFLKLLTDRQ